jgi:hypothetical protein
MRKGFISIPDFDPEDTVEVFTAGAEGLAWRVRSRMRKLGRDLQIARSPESWHR